ncbi:YedE family putative selenium transporter [Anaerovorax odorimutans]|uniref:YedE family putative selenium transporter n=1 Tax=Anaerovorax odorimutans TaxID=109327 RepID=A0ABT1RMQ1_9FIRM|nr:YedE family putative selenium transporter [Anaerovorax odorimutans]MCQ4636466.1 YedE family putative selenium transporter [Anaerovorax odorimutans]
MKKTALIGITGGIIGLIAVALVYFGNPGNMGFCIACFFRDTAGGIGLHRAEVVQYIRPEIIGLVFGALIMSLIGKEFSPRGGSSPAIRFVLAICVMVGALVFLGCPLRMMLRIGGGDLNAIVGLVGFIVGIAVGILCLNKGFTLNRAYKLSKCEGAVYPVINIGLLVLLVAAPAFIFFSAEGPGSMHAPIILSLIAGLVVGGLAQKSRFCTVAGIRDTILFKDTTMLIGFICVIAVAIIGNLIMGTFNLGFEAQPIAHSDGLWNFMGMVVVGFGSVLLGGCPLRQVILSGEGNTDSVVVIFGFITGAAICHNFGLASSAEGPSPYGPAAVIICLIVVALIAVCNLKKTSKA